MLFYLSIPVYIKNYIYIYDKILTYLTSPPPSSFDNGVPSRFKPINLTKFGAYVKFGSGCNPPKSGFGMQFNKFSLETPSSLPKIREAYGPAIPFNASKTKLKSSRCINV